MPFIDEDGNVGYYYFDDGEVSWIWFGIDRKSIMPKYNVSDEMRNRLVNSFTYHAPKSDQQERYVAIREKGKEMAFLLVENTPPSREQSLALTHLEDAIMCANRAIACNE